MTGMRNKDYSGGDFGAPNPRILTKAWRLKHGLRSSSKSFDATATLLGADSLSINGLPLGLPVYAGYNNGFYGGNPAQGKARMGGAPHYVSITPMVASGSMVLDVEPGDATAGDTPAFFRLGAQGGATKPWI